MDYELIAVIFLFILAVILVGIGEHAKTRVPLRIPSLASKASTEQAKEDYHRQQTMITLFSRGAAVIVVSVAFFAFMV